MSLGQARSAQGPCPRQIMSTEFDALWESLGHSREHLAAQGCAKGFTKGSESRLIFRKVKSQGKTAAQGSPKARPRPPPKAHRPRFAQGFVHGSAFGRLHKGGRAAFGRPSAARPPLWIPLRIVVWGMNKYNISPSGKSFPTVANHLPLRGHSLCVTLFSIP